MVGLEQYWIIDIKGSSRPSLNGKRNRPEDWLRQEEQLRPRNCLPDFGHYWFACNGLKTLFLPLVGQIQREKDFEGCNLSWTHEQMAVVVLMTSDQWEKFEIETPLKLHIKPDINKRYQTPSNKWIIPFMLEWKVSYLF